MQFPLPDATIETELFNPDTMNSSFKYDHFDALSTFSSLTIFEFLL
jgi:hypothetical protein